MGISALVPFRDWFAGTHDRRSADPSTEAAVGSALGCTSMLAALAEPVVPMCSPAHAGGRELARGALVQVGADRFTRLFTRNAFLSCRVTDIKQSRLAAFRQRLRAKASPD
ncbi:hypothetical protein [Paraburkholderia silvatlantica]|uniref:Uncharacterized protein n=1 Tax=Paraburkholderia silvatlantica TaxID=321895 RepID=A0ABR6FFY7_9BURK|nr:hypothetical protein [Paraburkholderia silvatlantica]MBB2926328.1 hypothetical protein [Paraburkholderia silvatlantica]